MRALVWAIVAVGVLALALGITAFFVIINANGSIPVGLQHPGHTTRRHREVHLAESRAVLAGQYLVSTSDGGSSVQQANSFVVNTTAGEHICVTVTVNRDGKLGTPSAPKCVDVGS